MNRVTLPRNPAAAGSLRQGFTLIELLVGLGLLGVVLATLTGYFLNSSRISVQSIDRAELQQELLNAQQLLTGRLREAWYVYPAFTNFNLGGSGSLLRRNPVRDSTYWVVGDDPVVAMILPPKDARKNCATAPEGCYRFFAYYAVRRGTWVSGTGGVTSPTSNNPGDDPANAEVWVLAEYRAHLPVTFIPAGFPPATPPTVPTNGRARILADYVAPTTGASPYQMFTYTNHPTLGHVTGVTVNLASLRQRGNNSIRLPGPSGTFTQAVSPTNLGATP